MGIALTSEVMTAIILNFTGEEIEPEAKSLAWEHCIQTGRMSLEAASSSKRGDSLQCPDKTGACPPQHLPSCGSPRWVGGLARSPRPTTIMTAVSVPSEHFALGAGPTKHFACLTHLIC